MSDKEALIKLLLSKTREAGESIKPGVERSGTPGPTGVESRAREACGSAKKSTRTFRGLASLSFFQFRVERDLRI